MIHRSIPDFVIFSLSSNMNNVDDNETTDVADVEIANAEFIEEEAIEQGIATTVATLLTQSSTKIGGCRVTVSQISDDHDEKSVSINSIKSPPK
jgi:hypothetical protein